MHEWNTTPPPKGAWVAAQWAGSDRVSIVQACQRGCCVHGLLGCMTLPAYWREATEQEISDEQRERARLSAANPELYWD